MGLPVPDMGSVGVLFFIGLPLYLCHEAEATVLTLPGGFQLDLWSFFLGDTPQSITRLTVEHFSLWLTVYSLFYLVLYVKPLCSFFYPWKLNPKYPPSGMVLLEFCRSARGIAICSLFSAIINSAHAAGTLPSSITPAFLLLDQSGDIPFVLLLSGGVISYIWGDFHFYWTHRLLHTRWLYGTVHMIHHQSFNPNPFSGLSMHWIESAIYFSSAPMLGLIVPLWIYRVISMSLILMPLASHLGYGSWETESTINHYIHHTKFKWNYGNSIIWDHIMGTNYSEESLKKRRNNHIGALEQAAMVNCKMN